MEEFGELLETVEDELVESVLEEGAGPEGPARPVSSLWILGTMSLLFSVAGAVAFLMMPRGAVLEVADTKEELFASVADPLPYGLVPEEARRLPSRELVLTYGVGSDAATSAATEEPVLLTFMQFPAQRAESVLEDQFQRLRFETSDRGGGRRRGGRGGGGRGGGGDSGGSGDKFGGSSKPKLQDAGFLDWQGFSANYARLRHTVPSEEQDSVEESGPEPAGQRDPSDGDSDRGASPDGDPSKGDGKKPKTYDTVRVNLSTGGRCIIAYVKFPIGVTGSKEAVSELLSSFSPLPPL